MMRTLKLTLAYDGTNYAGWQIQRGSIRTIQGTLQRALQRILQEPVKVIGSGRTDTGVHALGQVAHSKVRSAFPVKPLTRALNSQLPSDIVVTRIEEAAPTFHARYGAKAKRYRYRIVTGPHVLPFERHYVHRVRVPLDLPLMRREAKRLAGRHDFRAFHAVGRPVPDTRRTITSIRLVRRGQNLTIEITATGFLQTMARTIVGTLLDIGRGHRPAGTMAMLLKSRDRCLAGPTAPAKGLCLVKVTY